MSDRPLDQVPEPEWVIRGNRVKCTYCGLPLKTTAKYIAHFRKRHMNDDGTWRIAEHRYSQLTLLDDREQEALDIEQNLITKANRRVGKNEKPWWVA